MNWKKIDSEIRKFASSIQAPISVKDLGIILNGKITTYTFQENEKTHYKLVHTKPYSDNGSKFQMVSSTTNRNIQISLKKNFFGFERLKISGAVSKQVKSRLEDLSNLLFGFSWKTKTVKNAGENQVVLTFVTKDIEIDSETMKIIREIHQELGD